MSVLEGRLIIDSARPGACNMAVDEALLIDAAENGIATLRFYGWSEPTLSLGYFQRYEDRQCHPASRDCAIVRRQTGGGAILHDRELTYSLTIPPAHPLAKHNTRLYAVVHQAFINALSPLFEPATARWKLTRREESDHRESAKQPFLCFQRRAYGDVVLVPHEARTSHLDPLRAASQFPESHGSKVLGSAQRRYRGAVLQHGSLLLQRSPSAPELAGLYDLARVPVEADQLAELIGSRLENSLNMPLGAGSLALELQSKVEEITNNKYGSPVWTKRR